MNILRRLFNKLKGSSLYTYTDEAEVGNGRFYVKGWAFNKKRGYTRTQIVLESGGERTAFDIPMSERRDVHTAFDSNENALYSGFELSGTYESPESINVFFEGTHSHGVDRVVLAAGEGFGISPSLKAGKTVRGYVDYSEFKAERVSDKASAFPESLYERSYDVIIPIYNGFEFFEELFATVEKTDLKYRLIIINDASPDERVLPYLRNYADTHSNVVLIENKENLGFVQSVNKALAFSDMDAALVNSDVILPDKWLERLMLPIVTDSGIASSTPFTTCGTICSFPDFCKDNPLFLNCGVDEADRVFARFRPVYTAMPTGVGFCMGMSRQAINRVGMLNAEVFYKGYGEENDWCQRAIKLGYRNVHAENLFVWHKHGGSFLSEDKKRYIERNLKLLNEMHPNYGRDVEKYIKADPVRPYREFAKLTLLSAKAEKNIIMFDHDWGGGANSYSRKRAESENKNGYGVLKVIKNNGGMYAEYSFEGHTAGFALKDLSGLDDLIGDIGGFKKLIVNELVSFEDVYSVLEYILGLKERLGAELIMLGHDFYALCPSLYLIDDSGKHCFRPDAEKCRACIDGNKDKYNTNYGSIDKWREEWGKFLQKCDEITVFSNNSRDYFLHWYPMLRNIVVLPHTVDYMDKIPPYPTDKKKVVVGILGNFMRTKGSRVVTEMDRIIKEQKLPAEVVVVGANLDPEINTEGLKITGRYKPEDIPRIFEENKIDIVFIASIWPETFSYTTQEVINMGLPVASFDIGAPAERIKNYEKGLIIPEMTAECAVGTILEYIKK